MPFDATPICPPPATTPLVPDDRVLDALVKARDLVARHWEAGAGSESCLLRAVTVSTGNDWLMMYGTAPDDTVRANSLWRWNDRQGRTKAQVLALFDRAIAISRSQPAQRFCDQTGRAVSAACRRELYLALQAMRP